MNPGESPGGTATRLLGGVLGIVGTVFVHALVLAVGSARYAQVPPEEQGGLGLLVLAANPACTLLAWAPIAAFLIRRHKCLLQGFLVAVGLVVLLNSACWGVLAAMGA